jgi:hypothetical protein
MPVEKGDQQVNGYRPLEAKRGLPFEPMTGGSFHDGSQDKRQHRGSIMLLPHQITKNAK